MSITQALPAGVPTAPLATGPRPSGVRSAYRVERRKLSAQLAPRILALLCAAGPIAFAAVLKLQSGTPSDALFGVWVHSSGFAVSLVVLGFAGSWGFPVMAGVLAGDLFSCEDRYGTWKTVLTRSCSRRDMFVGKLLAAMTFTVALVLLTGVSSLVAGVILVGAQSLVSLSGVLLSPGRSLELVAISWLFCILPALAYTALAVLFSVATRNGIAGVLGPPLVALMTQLIDLIGKGQVVHLLLVGSAFDGWHGLFAAPAFYGALAVSAAVSLAWIAACVAGSWRLLVGKDFAATGSGARPSWRVAARLVAATVVAIALLTIASNWGPAAVTSARLRAAITPEFNTLTLLQQRQLGRAVPPGAKLNILPICTRRAGGTQGPGDWVCTMDVFIPQAGAVPFQETPVTYDVSVQSNGCYKAESPPTLVGQQTMRDARGDTVVNPLYVIYGCFNSL